MAEFSDFSFAAVEENPLIGQMSFIHLPQVGKELFDVQPLESDVGALMQMGLVKEVEGESIIHHEANQRFHAPKCNISATVTDVYGTASVGNGDPAAYDGLDYVQLHADSHSPKDGSDAGKYSYPRKGNIIEFANGGQWRVEAKRTSTANEHRLYLKKVNAAVPDLSATITTGTSNGGDVFSVPTTAWDEASEGQDEALIPSFTIVDNGLQTFRDYYEVTDFALKDKTYPLKWHNETINFVYNKGISDTEFRFAIQEDVGVFLTQKDDGTLTNIRKDLTEKQVKTTQGFIPQLEQDAQKIYYGNNPTLALFEEIIRKRRKRYQGNRAFMWMGFEFELTAKDIIAEFVKDGAATYNPKSLDLNIKMIQIGTFTLEMKILNTFNHPDITSIPGFPYPWYFVVCPTDKTKDLKTNIPEWSFQLRYKAASGEGARGHYKIWQTGAFADRATDRTAVKRIDLYSRKGMQVIGAKNFILGKRAV